MKVLITSNGRELCDLIESRFGRAKYYLMVDTESGEFTAHDNILNLQSSQGAGIQAASRVVKLGASAVITGHVGPKAFRVLQTAEIPVYLASNITGAEAVRMFGEGRLEELPCADVEGHWA